MGDGAAQNLIALAQGSGQVTECPTDMLGAQLSLGALPSCIMVHSHRSQSLCVPYPAVGCMAAEVHSTQQLYCAQLHTPSHCHMLGSKAGYTAATIHHTQPCAPYSTMVPSHELSQYVKGYGIGLVTQHKFC